MFETIADVEVANRAAGQHWFAAETMRFFNSAIESPLIAGRFFVTSERKDLDDPKRYTLREAHPNGRVETLGDFCGHHSLIAAVDSLALQRERL